MEKSILILSNNIDGLYSFRKEVIQAIKNAGYDIFISIPDIKSNKIPFFESIGCYIIPTIFDRRGINPFADIKLLFNYIKIIKRINPTAILTYTIKPNVYGGIASKFCRVPLLSNITGMGGAIENGGLMQKLSILLYKMGLQKTHCIFFQNLNNKNFFINQHIIGQKMILLPGSGVNLIYHKYQEYPKDDEIRFLYVGRILKDKGCGELFEMIRIIKKKYMNVHFQILGSFDDNAYKQQVNELVSQNYIVFGGYVDDVRPYLNKIHCTILPSYHEGMSNVNLESAANGRPVITTNVPGCKETVEDNITGYIIKPGDTEDLIQKVEKFIHLPYEKKKAMGMAARKKVEKEFNRNIVIDAYLNEIDKVKK